MEKMQAELQKLRKINEKVMEKAYENEDLKRQIEAGNQEVTQIEGEQLEQEIQLTKLRHLVESLIHENEILKAKIQMLGGTLEVDIDLNQANPNAIQFESTFQNEYFKTKEDLNSFKLENRMLKAQVRMQSDRIDDMLQDFNQTVLLKAKVKDLQGMIDQKDEIIQSLKHDLTLEQQRVQTLEIQITKSYSRLDERFDDQIKSAFKSEIT